MAANKDEGVYELTKFAGLKNVIDPERFELEDLEVAMNVDIDDSFEVKRRKGYESVLAGNFSSLWSNGKVCLAVKDGNTLVRVNKGWTLSTLKTGISGGPLSYATFGVNVGLSNGVVNGIVDEAGYRTWGIAPPTHQPVLTAVGGWNLPAGRYQVAATFLRNDLQESGTHAASVVDVPVDGGISITNIPQSADPDVTATRLYISRGDGATLYHYGDYPSGTTTGEIRGSIPSLGWPIQTQFLTNPPVGDHIAEFNGYSLVAKGDTLYYSEPYAYELFDLRKNFRFLHLITLVAPVDDGVYLGTTEGLVWLAGKSPSDWVMEEKFDYGAISGTEAYTTRDAIFKGEGDGPAVVFHSAEGICVGLPGGQITNITRERFDFPLQDRGAGIVRTHRGFVQYVAVLEGSGGAESNTATGSGTLPDKELAA